MEARRTISSKPLQMRSWADKIAKDHAYFKETADYYINLGVSGHNSVDGGGKAQIQQMYDVYNSHIPSRWFDHITDPLSAQNPLHKKFPTKIRPTNILRTNIDMLLSEWMRRPFKYHTESIGEDGYNRYTDQLNKAIHQNITQLFTAYAGQEMLAQGASEEEVANIDPASIPLPAEIKTRFQASYRDKIAIQAQKWLEQTMKEYSLKRKFHKLFKDWLLAGEAGSYKGVHNGELIYMRLSPKYLNYDQSPDTEFVEDGEWATYVHYMTISDVVTMFYKELTPTNLTTLESSAYTSTPQAFFSYLEGLYINEGHGKIPVYQTTWQGKKKVYFVKYIDPTTGEPQETYADENEYPVLKQTLGGVIEATEEWHNEAYETWRIGNDIYVRMQPVENQRNAMNNQSRTKLPINAKKYSNTHSENISIAQLGIPYLIMYIIVGRSLELTIAKSKGKILMMDNNAIPRTKGWNEERFFYYSEALGYGLLDRNQIGVDKQWNQYHVVDMSLYEQIEQLINLQNHYKQEWDDILGINRQRKGQTFASEPGVAVENAQFQSSVITDMIFIGFDEFIERELQGLIDLSKFININGLRRLYNSDMMRDTILEIDQNEYPNADIGVFIVDGLEDSKVLDAMKAQAPNFIQNGASYSTILEIFQQGNVAGLKAQLKEIEAIEIQMAQQNAENEAAAQQAADERKMKFMEYEKILEEQLINAEYDRKEDVEVLKGEFNILSYGNDPDANNNGVPDATEIVKRDTEREKMQSEERKQARLLMMQERLAKMKEFLSSQNKEADRRSNERMKEKELQVKLKTERIKARAKPKKPK